MQRIHALDGLRGVSIIFVCLAHFVPLIAGGQVARQVKLLGAPGVTVFFVISGYLITSLLLREIEKTGTISLYAFYRRRVLRITPAYVLFVVSVALCAWLGLTRVDPKVWPYVATYTYNLVPALDESTIGLVWSLCVEEHFYFLWPATLLLLGKRRALVVLGGTIVFAAVLRLGQPRWFPRIDADYFTFTRLDTIAVGCILAFVSAKTTRFRGWPWALLGTVVFFLSIYVFSRVGLYELGPRSLVDAASVALVTHALVHSPADPWTRFLDLAPMRLVGRLSYSLYLAQPTLNAFTLLNPPAWLRPLLLSGYAAFSYNVVELPFLRLKDRLEARDRARKEQARLAAAASGSPPPAGSEVGPARPMPG